MPRSRIQLLLIPIHNLLIQPNLILKNIHIRTRKLPRANPSLKEQIQLRKTPATRFRDAEVRVDNAEEADTRPEEAGEVSPVPAPRVEHVGRQDGADYADDVVQIAAEDHGLDLEATGGQFSDEGVAHCADGELVEEGPDEHYGARGEGALFFVCFRDKTQEAEDEEHGAETAEAVKVEGAATDSKGHQEPGSEYTGHVDAVLAEGEVVGFVVGEAGLLEEVGGVAREGIPG